MNLYLLAGLSLVAMLVVGFFVYGLFFKEALVDVQSSSVKRVILSAIGMYVMSLAFIQLYDATIFTSGLTGMVKGFYLGFLIGMIGMVFPLMMDGLYTKGTPAGLRAVTINWLVSFMLVGLVVGALR